MPNHVMPQKIILLPVFLPQEIVSIERNPGVKPDNSETVLHSRGFMNKLSLTAPIAF